MLSKKDKELLNLIQWNLPIAARPFKVVGELLNMSEDDVINGLKELKNNGYIRRIGPFFDSDKLEYKGCLVALRIREPHLEAVANVINSYSGITHNYQREGKYNLWFTLISNDENKRQNILSNIASLTGVEELLDLRSNKKFKINVQFKL